MLNKPLGRALLGVVVLLTLVVGWFILQVDPIFSTNGKVVTVTVHPNDSVSTVLSEMHTLGVLASPLAFRLDSVVFGSITVVPGSYPMAQNSSFSRIRAVLSSPHVDVTAGLTLHEVAVKVAGDMGNTYANAFLKDATQAVTPSPFHSSGSLEGLIGANDYVIEPGKTPAQLMAQMVAGFTTESASVGLTPSTTLNGLNAYQLVIAASIVEKEGYYPVNMPQVARVIFNRLARGGPLQMDATVLYYLGQDGGTVTPKMLQTQEPYNTYLNVGLTPTPICAVSTIALRATLHAPPGPWLYFTLVNQNGQEAFATTFAQQLANERLAQSRGIG